MRIHILTIIFTIIGFSCSNGKSGSGIMTSGAESLETKGEAEILFRNKEANLGDVKEGERVIAWYDYVNKGAGPLLIEDIEAGCGCTVPKWDSEPLMPGDSAAIKVVFNSSGKKGYQNIRVLVNSNAKNGEEVLRLLAQVEND